MWVQTRELLGQRFAQAFANNGDLVANVLDNLSGSSALISIRGRATFTRPFERIEALRRQADDRLRTKALELQTQLQKTEAKLTELQTKRNDQSSLMLTPEQERSSSASPPKRRASARSCAKPSAGSTSTSTAWTTG